MQDLLVHHHDGSTSRIVCIAATPSFRLRMRRLCQPRLEGRIREIVMCLDQVYGVQWMQPMITNTHFAAYEIPIQTSAASQMHFDPNAIGRGIELLHFLREHTKQGTLLNLEVSHRLGVIYDPTQKPYIFLE